jgi:ABC-type antimicrobial peptide transport system permease subunit
MIFFVTIVIGVISGIIPALSTRKINPLESIRYE